MSPAPASRNVLGLLGAFMVAAMVTGVLVAGLFLPVVGASGVTASKSVDFFNSIPGDLQTPPLAEGSKVLSADGKVIAKFFDQNRVNVPLDKISKTMQQAVIAIEDARYYQHGGVDPQGLARAFVVNQVKGEVAQGASTLTQQYVKNVLVQTAYAKGDKAGQRAATADDNGRKVKEIRYAVSLEQKLSKDEILNRYLNIAWFGGITYGVEAAGLLYFNTHAKDLNLTQSAMLAGMIQSPPEWSPTKHPKAAKTRRDVVLGVMRDQKVIDEAQYQEAKAAGLGVELQDLRNGCANTSLAYGFYCDYVWQLLTKNDAYAEALGKTKEDRETTLKRGGLTIKTALVPKVQEAATKAVNEKVPSRNSPGVGAAAVTVEPGTGKVLAIAVNRTWDPDESKRGHTSTNYAVDYEYGGSNGFQTGSTFKPFTLATWLKKGKSLNAVVNSNESTDSFSQFKSCVPMDKSQVYKYGNSEGQSRGNISVFQATYASVNAAYVNMEKQLNLCDIVTTAESFGMHSAKPRPDICVQGNPLTVGLFKCSPALTLGIMDISPMTMAAAYAGFAAQGLYCTPIAVSSITDRDGNNVPVPQSKCNPAVEKKVAATLTYGLSRVFKPGGTAARVGGLPGGRDASGKTGTTNDSKQTWFAGYTTKLATAVWVGIPTLTSKNDTLNRRTIDGRVTRVFGATYAAPIWKQLMSAAVQGTPKEKFPRPDQELLKSPTAVVPNVDGRDLASAIAALRAAGFDPSPTGGAVNSKYPAGRVASTSPAGGSRVATGSQVVISISNGIADPGNDGGGLLGGAFPGGNGGGPGPG